MKKYKLIKTYPGYFNLGRIVEIHSTEETGYYSENTEYWEEVIEKDYEIISYVAKDNPTNITTKRRGAHLHEEYWKIYKIKRLSDGEIFTVDDLIKTPFSDTVRITRFQNPEGNEYFIEIPTGFTRLSTIEKIKQPILFTYKGNYIFAGDKVWYVNKENLYYDYAIAISQTSFNPNTHAYFLTEEEASDYIQKNKVLFITMDGVGIKKNEVVYVVDGRLNSIDMISNFVPKDYPTFKAFSTSKAAENYIIQHKYTLSIEDFWEFVSWGGSNIAKSKRLKRLVKKRLNLK